jgi:hypothetical protein
MTRIQSFILAPILISIFVSGLFIIDVLRQRPDIPPQAPDVSYEDIILGKKKRNSLDDFCVPCEVSY